jgi:hypothetical protein
MSDLEEEFEEEQRAVKRVKREPQEDSLSLISIAASLPDDVLHYATYYLFERRLLPIDHTEMKQYDYYVQPRVPFLKMLREYSMEEEFIREMPRWKRFKEKLDRLRVMKGDRLRLRSLYHLTSGDHIRLPPHLYRFPERDAMIKKKLHPRPRGSTYFEVHEVKHLEATDEEEDEPNVVISGQFLVPLKDAITDQSLECETLTLQTFHHFWCPFFCTTLEMQHEDRAEYQKHLQQVQRVTKNVLSSCWSREYGNFEMGILDLITEYMC